VEPVLAGLAGALFVAGLVSGVHCIGMCGGIVTAFGTQPMIRLHPERAPRADIARQLAFNAGRLATYASLGAVAGLAGGVFAWIGGALPAQTLLYVLANLMLVLAGLYLAGLATPLARLEALALPLWRRLQPTAARLFAASTLPRAFGAGLAWGVLPCGLVYGALAAAAFAGSAAGGAATMLAFGLGTLPTLFAAGMAAARLRRELARPRARLLAGAILLGFGAFGLAHAGGLADQVRRGLLCL
jgi:sulfite exporter TauE/SafE